MDANACEFRKIAQMRMNANGCERVRISENSSNANVCEWMRIVRMGQFQIPPPRFTSLFRGNAPVFGGQGNGSGFESFPSRAYFSPDFPPLQWQSFQMSPKRPKLHLRSMCQTGACIPPLQRGRGNILTTWKFEEMVPCGAFIAPCLSNVAIKPSPRATSSRKSI